MKSTEDQFTTLCHTHNNLESPASCIEKSRPKPYAILFGILNRRRINNHKLLGFFVMPTSLRLWNDSTTTLECLTHFQSKNIENPNMFNRRGRDVPCPMSRALFVEAAILKYKVTITKPNWRTLVWLGAEAAFLMKCTLCTLRSTFLLI
jgi:hypothetical protein